MTDRMEECPPRMWLYKILNGVIPSMYRTPCKIAIFADGQKIKVFERVRLHALPFDSPHPQTWERQYPLERYRTPQRLEKYLRESGLLKENDHE